MYEHKTYFLQTYYSVKVRLYVLCIWFICVRESQKHVDLKETVSYRKQNHFTFSTPSCLPNFMYIEV